MAEEKDMWVIENNTLIKYKGWDSKVIIPDGIEIIGEKVFSNSSIKEITIPDSVTEIKDGAFDSCYYLQRITLPKGLKKIGSCAFADSSLEEIIIPDSVTEIGKSAFACVSRFNSNLKKVTLSNNLKKIAASIFHDSNIEEIIIPDSVEEIEECAFFRCKKLKKVILSNNLKKIGELAFGGTSLEEITIPENVTEIKGSFKYCENLKKIELPKGLTKISKSLFEESGIEEIIIPDSVEEIEEFAFSKCANLKRIVLPRNLKKIGNYAFGGSGLEEIIIPDSVTEIGRYAFSCCQNLKKVKLPNNFEPYMKSYVFCGCTNIEEVIMPSAFAYKIKQNPDEYQLMSSENHKSYFGLEKSPTIITKIPNEELIIPEGITRIDDFAFQNCQNLKRVTLPASLKAILFAAFSDCENLEEIIIPDNVTRISISAFRNCSNLKKVKFPQNNVMIDNNAFVDCTALEEIEVFDTSSFGSSVFNNCPISKIFLHGRVIKRFFENFEKSPLKEIHLSYNLKYTLEDLGSLKEWGIKAKIIVHNCNLNEISYFTSLKWKILNVFFEDSNMPEIKPTKIKMSDDIEELLDKIKNIANLLNPQDSKKIVDQVEKLVSNYRVAIKDKKPKFGSDEKFSFKLEKDYLTLKQ